MSEGWEFMSNTGTHALVRTFVDKVDEHMLTLETIHEYETNISKKGDLATEILMCARIIEMMKEEGFWKEKK